MSDSSVGANAKIRTERASLPGREDLTLRLEVADAVATATAGAVSSAGISTSGAGSDGFANGTIKSANLSVIGGPATLASAVAWRSKLSGKVSALPLPAGESPFEILLRELILKMKGEWKFPYNEDEVCHCRVVSRETIDAAIICGAHTPQRVSEWTSASTACGTCRPDVTAMIAYRLGR